MMRMGTLQLQRKVSDCWCSRKVQLNGGWLHGKEETIMMYEINSGAAGKKLEQLWCSTKFSDEMEGTSKEH